jgi:hypothetical protein
VISAGVDVEWPCDFCESQQVCQLVQHLVSDRLQWTVEGHCPSCGSIWETFGWDDTPDEVRDPIVAQLGLFRLTVDDPDTSRMGLLRVFRGEGQSLATASASARRAMAEGVEGTEVELARLARRLGEHGVSARVTPPSPR